MGLEDELREYACYLTRCIVEVGSSRMRRASSAPLEQKLLFADWLPRAQGERARLAVWHSIELLRRSQGGGLLREVG